VPENFDEFSADAEQFIDSGEHVVVVGRFRGRAKSGTVLDAPFVHVWKMRNGKAANFYHHVETSTWPMCPVVFYCFSDSFPQSCKQ
jgi:ketosteroid isomerase-like protein